MDTFTTTDQNKWWGKYQRPLIPEERFLSLEEIQITRELLDQLCLFEANIYRHLPNLKPSLPPHMIEKMMACLTWGNGGLSPEKRLKLYLMDVNFHAGGTYGYVMNANFREHKDFLILKVPRNPTLSPMIYHEALVGLAGTNTLRSKIFNFAYVYGIFTVGQPKLTKSKELLDWGSEGRTKYPYVIYESLTSAIPFTEFVETASASEFMTYYLQVMLALQYAHREIKFTHYDLSTSNLLLQEVSSQPIYLFYPPDVYIRSPGRIAVVIDYGTAYFERKSRPHGYPISSVDLRDYGMLNNRPFPINDAYKLLCWGLVYSSSEVRDQLKGLLRFFNKKEEPNVILSSQRERSFFVPWSEERDKTTLGEWITYCRHHLTKIGIEDPIVTSLPEGVTPFSPSYEMKEISSDSWSLFQIYDLYRTSIPTEMKGIVLSLVEKIELPLLKPPSSEKREEDTYLHEAAIYLDTFRYLKDVVMCLSFVIKNFPEVKRDLLEVAIGRLHLSRLSLLPLIRRLVVIERKRLFPEKKEDALVVSRLIEFADTLRKQEMNELEEIVSNMDDRLIRISLPTPQMVTSLPER